MKTNKEYQVAHDYFANKFNEGIHTPEIVCVLSNMTRAGAYETAAMEAEKTARRLRELKRHQMKLVIDAYRKENGL